MWTNTGGGDSPENGKMTMGCSADLKGFQHFTVQMSVRGTEF